MIPETGQHKKSRNQYEEIQKAIKKTRRSPALRNTRPRDLQEIIRLPTGNARPRSRKSNKASHMPKTKRWRAQKSSYACQIMGATREKPPHNQIGPKTGVGSYPEQEASHHASLKEFGSLIDQGKGKPLQVNKYGSRASCPITTGSSRIFMNMVAFHSKIIIIGFQTKESNN